MAKPSASPSPSLSRREREVMDILYARRQANARDVQNALPQAPSYSAVRSILRILVQKGRLRKKEGTVSDVYTPALAKQAAQRFELRRVVESFFENSVAATASALLSGRETKLTEQEAERLIRMIKEAKKA